MAQHAEASKYSSFLVYRLLSVTGICCCSYGHQSHRLDRNQPCIPLDSDIQLHRSHLPHRCSWETCIFHRIVWEEAKAAWFLQRKDTHLYINQVRNFEAILNQQTSLHNGTLRRTKISVTLGYSLLREQVLVILSYALAMNALLPPRPANCLLIDPWRLCRMVHFFVTWAVMLA